MSVKEKTKAVLRELEKNGLLMCHDSVLPSATTIIADELIKGSWWPHKKGSLIFHTLNEVLDTDGVLAPKLINGKVTLIHKDLFNDFFTIVYKESDWQIESLKDDADLLLGEVKKKGSLRSDRLTWNQRRKLGKSISGRIQLI